MESQFYTKTDSDSVECQLCPHNCQIKNERVGICNARINQNGVLESMLWGVISSSSLDPIEKKPLYQFYPGRMIYSIGGYGCNLNCIFCQNFQISQYVPQNIDNLRIVSPSEVVQKAKILPNNIGIAFTYNEPTISFEYMLETSRLSHKQGMKNVMVSNGFINPKPLSNLLETIDAFNIDLKAFSESFYHKNTGGNLEPILKTLKAIRKSGKHLEITFLVIPNLNDNEDEAIAMFDWIANELGKETILHLSRYHPTYLLDNPPTPSETLQSLYKIAKDKLHYVYLGNILTVDGNNTICPKCNSIVIKRIGYNSAPISIDKNGKCKHCGFGPIIINK
jgi:pyruvate formate lyase activating enzyme